jgi:hypothetical protein
MNQNTTIRHKAAIIAGLMLSVTVAISPASRRAVAWMIDESIQAVEKVIDIRALSLDRLDPTCPKCL